MENVQGLPQATSSSQRRSESIFVIRMEKRLLCSEELNWRDLSQDLCPSKAARWEGQWVTSSPAEQNDGCSESLPQSVKDTTAEARPVCGTGRILPKKRVLFWQLESGRTSIIWRWFREEPQGLQTWLTPGHTRNTGK